MRVQIKDNNVMKSLLKLLPLVWMLAGCGGGGDTPPTSTSLQPVVASSCVSPNVLQSGVCVSVANMCQTETEKTWVRAYLDDEYLWYNEIVEVPKENYNTPQGYFNALLVKTKDHFSFTQDQVKIDGFFESGTDMGYGIMWVSDPVANNSIRVAAVDAKSPAALQGILRGDYLLSVDGVSIYSMTRNDYIEALYPPEKGVTHTFEIYRSGFAQAQQIVLTSADTIQDPVPLATVIPFNNKNIGYLLFNDHIATATSPLIAAVRQFQIAKIDDMVLDLRYNTGGYLYVADELASMLRGNITSRSIFTSIEYNDKHSDWNRSYFFTNYSFAEKSLMPMLSLNRIYILTSNMTCSASEAIINSLSPFLEVIRIGSTTCGKPYGFNQENNCGIAYFAINFQSKNSIGQTVPTAGYAPTCAAYDDLNNPLGSPMEGMLASALSYQEQGQCTLPTLMQSAKAVRQQSVKELYRAPWRSNMVTSHN